MRKSNSNWFALVAILGVGCSNGSKANDAAGGEGGSGGTHASVTATSDGTVTSGSFGVTGANPTSSTTGAVSAVGGMSMVGQGGAPDETGAGGEAGAAPDMPDMPDMPSACPGFDADSLEVATVDADCDVYTPDACEAGTHIYLNEEDACAVCMPDTAENRSCSWAEACFEPFLQTIAHRSGAKRCQTDSDCSSITMMACGQEVDMALYALIDEEIPMIAEQYAEQNCGLCGDESFFDYDIGPGSACVAGTCTLRN